MRALESQGRSLSLPTPNVSSMLSGLFYNLYRTSAGACAALKFLFLWHNTGFYLILNFKKNKTRMCFDTRVTRSKPAIDYDRLRRVIYFFTLEQKNVVHSVFVFAIWTRSVFSHQRCFAEIVLNVGAKKRF